jgi:AcrR family transcriptional regulator
VKARSGTTASPTTGAVVGPRRRGRPPQITLDQVVRAAAEIGLEDLTVQAVADHLGVTRAAVYHYVESTDELRRLAAYGLLPAFELIVADLETWQDWLRAFAAAGRKWRLENAHLLEQLSIGVSELPWMLVVLDEGIDRLLKAGFSLNRAGHALQFVGGLLWINSHDEIVARQAPGGRHPQAVAMQRSVHRSDLNLEHIPDNVDLLAFANPDDRFRREIEWAISALELELSQSDATSTVKAGRSRSPRPRPSSPIG